MLTDEELQDISRWLHRVDHLRWRKGLWVLPEGEMVSECWMPDMAPAWAVALALAGEPGSRWCPQINTTLTVDE